MSEDQIAAFGSNIVAGLSKVSGKVVNECKA